MLVSKEINTNHSFLRNHCQIFDVEISDDMYILKSEEAKKNIEPRKLASIKIIPPAVTLEPKKLYHSLQKDLISTARK